MDNIINYAMDESDEIMEGGCQAPLVTINTCCKKNRAAGTIIPFASGLPVTLTTTATGSPSLPSYVGFGSSSAGISTLSGATIDLTNGDGIAGNFAFSMPRNGIITGLSAFFSTTLPLSLTATSLSVTATVYTSTAPSNIFTNTGISVTLSPVFSGAVPTGTIAYGITNGFSLYVPAQTRVLLVFTASASGTELLNTIVGYASAGLEIR